jgi:hypothetical protein
MNKYKMKINDIIENMKVQEVNSRSEVWNSIPIPGVLDEQMRLQSTLGLLLMQHV